MRDQRDRRHIDLDHLDPIELDGEGPRVVRAHANPRRHRHGVEDPRDDRHQVHRLLHDIERGLHPDDVA